MTNEITTRSPGWKRRTSGPTSSTTPIPSWPMTSPGVSGILPWRKWRSEPQIAAARIRTIASFGSSIRGSATSRTASCWTPSNTTAFIEVLRLVDELGGNGLRQIHELVGSLDVANDGREIALQLELPLHHPLDGVELLADHFLPPRIGGPDDEPGLLALVRRQPVARVTALPVPQVEPRPHVLRESVVGFG